MTVLISALPFEDFALFLLLSVGGACTRLRLLPSSSHRDLGSAGKKLLEVVSGCGHAWQTGGKSEVRVHACPCAVEHSRKHR
ncbi:hypothetical protein DPX16_5636 [Anabarilius grahami]|uniref:Uncharacterized protein n=1 Tax=Anabarilius grahami TaxID=495550 RepID=A0A3N0YPV3_ANAGA|nr:hypothetical protein DPX16_5636 [Anabarilius grahami]